MKYFKSFSEKVNNIGKYDFEELALELFHFQSQHNEVYKAYCQARKVEPGKIQEMQHIPFLPIQFFKNHKVTSGNPSGFRKFYSSSGTTGQITSRHYIWSGSFYLKNAQRIFEQNYGRLNDYHILALLPAYLERKGSSLVAMANHFIQNSGSSHSGFYLYNYAELMDKIHLLKNSHKKILLLGVTFALLDMAEISTDFPKTENLIIMETGGMKGRRKEMVREELHEILKRTFHVDAIHSEYGMTELFSQSYSKKEGKYILPDSMCVYIRDINDPFSVCNHTRGGINLIDLANFHSCAFIETQDLGKLDENGCLEILGRFDNSEIRGCNLMIQ